MYPDEFDYKCAQTVDEALTLIEEHADDETELLAGGHSLIPTMKSGLSSPEVLIDIGGIDALTGIENTGEALVIGAMTPYREVADSDAVWENAPALAEAVSEVGDEQVQSRGTIGGNIAHSDPASDLPGAVLASDLTMVARGPDGERRISADDFFQGMYMTALGEEEILTQIEIALTDESTVGGYAKKPSPSSGYALVGVAVMIETDGDTVTAARVGANGVMDRGVRLDAVEDALAGEEIATETAETVAQEAGDSLDTAMMMDDLQASAEFRGRLLQVYTERVLETVFDRAESGTPLAAD